MDHCDDCGFVYDEVAIEAVPAALRALGPRYLTRLEGDPAALRRRPSPDVWSALEYACHVRDVLRVQRDRLQLALVEDCPAFTPMGRDERVSRDHYNDQMPRAVAEQLVAAADAMADDCERLRPDQWQRVGIYNWPAPAERTMAWLARHTIHEGEHHLRDVDSVLLAS